MDETRTGKYYYTTMGGLKNAMKLTDTEIRKRILNGTIEPVVRANRQFYRYDPYEIRDLYYD